MTKLYLIDANAYVHRAYHALPPLTNSKGEMVNAVYGFTRMILKLLKQGKPEYAIVCFDFPAPTFRHKKYAEYKANRKEIDDALKHQMPLARESANALNLLVVEKEGYEADDIIATLASQARKDKMEVVVISGDKDVRQLVDDGITVWDEAKNTLYDENKVVEKYGLEPKQLVDMFALMGDVSDNVPGIKGIGEKTATKLIKEFGSVENLIKNYSKLEGRVKVLIEENGKDAEKSKDLIRLHYNVPLEINWRQGEIKPFDNEKLEKFLQKMEFKSLIKELIPGSSEKMEKEEAAFRESGKKKYKTNIIYTEKELIELSEKVVKSGLVSLDLETTSTDPHKAQIVGFSFAITADEAYYLPVGHTYSGASKQVSLETSLSILKDIFEDVKIKKYGQNIKYDMLVLKQAGIELDGIYFDSMVASYCINPSRSSHGLKNIALDYANFPMTAIGELIGKGAKQITMAQVEIEKAADYACADAVAVLMLKEKFEA
ncbi:MAG: DNA polymerase I, partial [Elusimicrobia bacterium]|nr:DNA polymerase I [Elusimicrobiota bacterium]